MAAASDRDQPAFSVDLFLEAVGALPRRREPVTCGLPFPRRQLFDPSRLRLCDDRNRTVLLQTRVLDRWPDNSVRWLLLDWLADVEKTARYRLQPGTGQAPRNESVAVRERDGAVIVATAAAEFRVKAGGAFPFASIRLADGASPT